MALFKRVLEFNGKFIPQKYGFISGWYAIDKDGFEWSKFERQVRYCSYGTLEEAKAQLITKIHKA